LHLASQNSLALQNDQADIMISKDEPGHLDAEARTEFAVSTAVAIDNRKNIRKK
jgi:hypothetical protein